MSEDLDRRDPVPYEQEETVVRGDLVGMLFALLTREVAPSEVRVSQDSVVMGVGRRGDRDRGREEESS